MADWGGLTNSCEKKWSGIDMNWLEFGKLMDRLKQTGILDVIGSELAFKLVGFFGKNAARKKLLESLEKAFGREEQQSETATKVKAKIMKGTIDKLKEFDDLEPYLKDALIKVVTEADEKISSLL